jgi:hypothetical protein
MNNAQRKVFLVLSRDWKELLPRLSPPAWLRTIIALLVAIVGRRWAYRVTFTADDRMLRIAAHHVLADLRMFCFATADGRRPIFASDPLVMARRLGRREAFDRIIKYLNLDEAQVQAIMEIDDGI